MSRISDEEFFGALDQDLFEKFLTHGEAYFDDAAMRSAYLQIQGAREAKARAIIAHNANAVVQAKRIGS